MQVTGTLAAARIVYMRENFCVMEYWSGPCSDGCAMDNIRDYARALDLFYIGLSRNGCARLFGVALLL